MHLTRVLTTLLLVCVVVAILGASASPGTTKQGTEPFTIRSSLDGKTVLPHRIRWIAYPSAPVLFPGVEFLIDGKLVFANRLPPFAFGDDGRDEETGKVSTGFLVTAWLAPGTHRFTVRGKAIVGGKRTSAETTVTARVPASPTPPSQLVGTWQRQIHTAIPPDPDRLYSYSAAPPGTYRIVIDRRYVRASGVEPRKHANLDYVANPRTLTIRGPVWTGDPYEVGVCDPWGPDATYSWSVSESRLTFEPAGQPDACKGRGAIMTGEWTRGG